MRTAWLLVVVLASGCVGPDVVTLGTTTTVRDSGLLDALQDAYATASGETLRVVVAGSGDMAERARRGDVDVTLTHAPRVEAALVADGVAAERVVVFTSRFVIVGPPADPAGVADASNATAAFARIAAAGSPFVSRGDGSGTHEAEIALWQHAGAAPRADEHAWYTETGSGQAATLRVAHERDAYAFTDEPTWWRLSSADGLPHLAVLFAAADLVNPYAVLVVAGHDGGARFAAWLTTDGRTVVADHATGGRRLFTVAEV